MGEYSPFERGGDGGKRGRARGKMVLVPSGNVEKDSSSKAAGSEKAEAYSEYVEDFEQREHRWRTVSTFPFAETKGPRLRGRNPA